MRRRSLLICALGMALAAGPAAAATASGMVPVRVRPAVGGPRRTFTVSLRVPLATGTSGTMRRSDTVSVTGPHRRGCVSTAARPLPAAATGSLVRVRLVPHKRWCVGTFHGVVTEAQSVACPPQPGIACPMLAIRPQTIGRFRFRVHH